MLNARHDDDAAGYSKLRHNWVTARRQEHLLGSLIDAVPGQLVLEVGAGTGDVLLHAAQNRPDLRFLAVEPLENYVEFANERVRQAQLPNVRFVQGFAESLTDVVDSPADWLVSNDVLHHVADVGAAVESARAVSRAGTRWLATEPSWVNPYIFAMHALTEGERNFYPRAFIRAATAAGWQVASRRYIFLIPSVFTEPPAWMQRAERTLERVPGLAGGVSLELRAGPETTT